MRALLHVRLTGLPPTANHLYRTSRNGVRYKTAEGKAWQELTATILRGARRRGDKDAPPFNGDVAVKIVFYTKDRKHWDIDNRLKALLDCLEDAGVIANDAQVKRLEAHRVEGKPTPTTVSGKPAVTELTVRAVKAAME